MPCCSRLSRVSLSARPRSPELLRPRTPRATARQERSSISFSNSMQPRMQPARRRGGEGKIGTRIRERESESGERDTGTNTAASGFVDRGPQADEANVIYYILLYDTV